MDLVVCIEKRGDIDSDKQRFRDICHVYAQLLNAIQKQDDDHLVITEL